MSENLQDRDHERWLEAAIMRLRAVSPGHSYTLDPVEIMVLLEEIDRLRDALQMKEILDIIHEQSDDEGLWFIDATCSEAYLQAALRRLHAAIETSRVTSHDRE